MAAAGVGRGAENIKMNVQMAGGGFGRHVPSRQ
jgi:hypothetical protein